MGVYRLYTGSDGESHLEEIGTEALQQLKVTGTMTVSVQERVTRILYGFPSCPLPALAGGAGGMDDDRAV